MALVKITTIATSLFIFANIVQSKYIAIQIFVNTVDNNKVEFFMAKNFTSNKAVV